MKVHGLQKLTLTDYPERVACILFTGMCNFRCPFCYNAPLVLHPESEMTYSDDEIFSFLRKRVGILDGVVITGGEPTLQPDLLDFMKRVKDLRYLLKLDSNGTNPEMLREAIEEKIVDYIAMDVKNSLEKYPVTVGLENYDTKRISESIELLKEGKVEYEFRTTVVKEFHDDESFDKIAVLCSGADKYFLQTFVDTGDIIGSGLSSPSEEDMVRYKAILETHIKTVQIRN